ncbi:hypothetical protein [Sphingobium sp. 15-1]|uniref:hypothetical protein n=2 Tax=Sphingobium TaxID=165695 RepID=UPI00159C4EEB|nr:hypothetical protein [Sphingobium sp. 15-1]
MERGIMNISQNSVGLAVSLIQAQSRLPSVPASELIKLQRLECLLTTARDKLARGGALSRADMQRLNGALDDLQAT